MAYSPPSLNSVDFDASGSYTPPAIDSVALALPALSPYAPPAIDALDFDATGSYSPPAIDSVALDLVGPGDGGGDEPDVQLPPSGVDVLVGGGYGTRAATDVAREIPWGAYRRPNAEFRSRTEAFRRPSAQTRSPWGEFRHLAERTGGGWQPVERALEDRVASPWNDLQPRDRRAGAPWVRGMTPRSGQTRAPWLVPPAKDRLRTTRYDHADPSRRDGTTTTTRQVIDPAPPYEPPTTGSITFRHPDGYTPPHGAAVDFEGAELADPPNVAIGPREIDRAVRWRAPPARDWHNRLPWGPQGSRDREAIEIDYPQEPDEDAPPEIPESKRVYLVMPSIEAKRVSDNTVVWLNSARIQTDRDSWTWQLEAEPARREDRDAIKPTSSGPVEIQVTINGHPWHFLVESHRRTRGHRGSSFSATGRSPSALLADPYTAPATRTETSARSAQQLANDELANTSWLLTWNATDWNVPANVYSYQGLTPIQSIRRIAEAIGAVAYTAPDSRDLIVDPYYVDSPWDWSGSSADVVLTEDLILQIDSEWRPGPGYNAIFCAGRQQGVIVHVVRSGTAQDTEAEMVVDDLITERLAGRERGRQELATAGDRERVTITLPMLPDPEPPGLVLPGKLVEVQEGGETWRGQVMATDVQASRQNATTVRQTIEVERWHG